MVIDSSVVINLPHDGEFRVKKREGPEEIRPVEKSGDGDKPELDIGKDKITGKTPETRRFDAGELYNKYGEIDRERNREDNTGIKANTIDVIV
ncbi:MAG: hypothetical protein JXL81_09880 [Deltaproteobacteria bacterium]|nr:hypothetical protein [Deltaproteobacteria bacterium]